MNNWLIGNNISVEGAKFITEALPASEVEMEYGFHNVDRVPVAVGGNDSSNQQSISIVNSQNRRGPYARRARERFPVVSSDLPLFIVKRDVGVEIGYVRK